MSSQQSLHSRVYVGIVTYNSVRDLPRCLDGLRHQLYSEIVITALDNASNDGSVTWIREHAPDVRVIANFSNVGFACAHNQIMQSCLLQPGEYYLPLNPDVVLTPGYISALVNVFVAAPMDKIGWATGKLLLIDDSGRPTGQLYSAGHALHRDGYAVNIGYNLPDAVQWDAPREVFGAPGAAPLISQALIAAIAPHGEMFDAQMFMYAEDTDLDWRARRNGWHCWYVPQAVAYHRGSRAQGSLQIQALGNRYLSVIKNAYPLDLLTYNLPLILIHCLLRLLLTPRRGLQLIGHLMRLGPIMWQKRQPAQISRAEMLRWFAWSRRQPSEQPTTWRGRIQSMLQQRLARRHA